MPWICPNCKRSFKNPSQPHSCIVTGIDDHFVKKDILVRDIFCKLEKAIIKFGNVKINPTKHAIIVSSKSTFLAIKPRKTMLDIEFLLDKATEGYPVYKIFKVSKNRFAHFIHLEYIEQVDRKLISLLKQSYKTINK
jgi:hypothetical protein